MLFFNSTISLIESLRRRGDPRIGLPWDVFHAEGLEFWDKVNFLKGGLIYSEMLSTVSPSYAGRFGPRTRAPDWKGFLGSVLTTLLGFSTVSIPTCGIRLETKLCGLPTTPTIWAVKPQTNVVFRKSLDSKFRRLRRSWGWWAD